VLFTEPLFLFLFLPVLLALVFARRDHGAWANWVLACASVLFYAKGGGWFTLLMLASIAFNYRMAITVERSTVRKRDRIPGGWWRSPSPPIWSSWPFSSTRTSPPTT
jgi:D-alanyl-lipoteichoic acid acyltransferase DltB (MBOAT superfamily)